MHSDLPSLLHELQLYGINSFRGGIQFVLFIIGVYSAVL